jgi:hypothetical protein
MKNSVLSEPVPYPGRELVWPGFGVYIHPVAQQVLGGIGRGKGVDLSKSKSQSKRMLSKLSRLEMVRYPS